MNIREWEEVQPTVVYWSMYNKDDEDIYYNTGNEIEHYKIELVLDANHPDGVYDAYVDNRDGGVGRYGGVVVKDGKFDPVETSRAVFNASLVAWEGEFDHIFIEKMEWNEDLNAFVASMGS